MPVAIDKITPGQVAFVQADDWFFGPDGRTYRGVFGPTFIIKAEDALGFRPKNSADWFVQVGDGEEAVLIAGCRVHYVGLYAEAPKSVEVLDLTA